MNKSQEMMVFGRLHKLTSAIKLRPEVALVEKLTGSLYWWVELCVPESATALSDMCVYAPQKSLNDTLAVDLPFLTLAVYFSLNL